MFPKLRAQVVGNPVTGEAYLLLDAPENPPPPIALGFKPDRAYIPSMPTPMAAFRDRLPEVLERAEATLQILRDIVAKIPDSLDRSHRFFTNVERIVQESNLPALSADSRKFFATTSAQFERMTSEIEGVIGTRGTLVTFVDEARAAIKAADLPATNQSARAAAEQSTLAADDLRRSLPAIRDSLEQLRDLARQLAGAAGVRGLRSTPRGGETMISASHRRRSCRRRHRQPGGSRVPAEAARHDTDPHARAPAARAAMPEPAATRARAPPTRRPSGCSIRKRADTSAAACFTSNRTAS